MVKEKRIKLAEMNPEPVSKEIGDFVVEHILRFNQGGGVIGLSGGVDSTATSAILKKAFDSCNRKYEKSLELVGYILPSATNAPEDESDGVKVAKRLGLRYEIISIEPLVQAYAKTNPEAINMPFHKGNLISRIRANVLSTKAATEDKFVIGTGNRDEDFGIGYYTLFGDGAVHISPIGALPKRLVRQMASYLGFKDLANRIPTAGLEKGQTDFGDLGYDYDLVEIITEGFLQGFSMEELYRHPQVVPVAEMQILQYEKLFGRKKFDSAEGIVNDIKRRNNIAKSKAKIVSPPIAPVTLMYR